MFLNHLYGGMDERGSRSYKLRKKLANASDGKDFTETARGRGYVLREQSEDEARISA
jgi:two-component system cell cycle response regulator CtrA